MKDMRLHGPSVCYGLILAWICAGVLSTLWLFFVIVCLCLDVIRPRWWSRTWFSFGIRDGRWYFKWCPEEGEERT